MQWFFIMLSGFRFEGNRKLVAGYNNLVIRVLLSPANTNTMTFQSALVSLSFIFTIRLKFKPTNKKWAVSFIDIEFRNPAAK